MSLDTLQASVDGALTEMQTTHDKIERALKAKEDTKVIDELANSFDQAETRHKQAVSMFERAKKLDALVTKNAPPQSEIVEARAATPNISNTFSKPVEVTKEEHVYRRNGEHSFFVDVEASKSGSPAAGDAKERLYRHLAQYAEYRSVSSVALAGGEFAPPIWLLEEAAQLARARRPFADAVLAAHPTAPLIPGSGAASQINIPRTTQASLAAAQTADFANVSEQNFVTEELSVYTSTVATSQNVSYQLRDFSPMAIDQMVYADMAADIARVVDYYLLAGSGAGNQPIGVLNTAGITTVTYTDATPTFAELYPKLLQAQNEVMTTRYSPATVCAMHPRRWSWLLAQLETSGRPFVTPYGAMNAPATITDNVAEGIVGALPTGIPVMLNANIPTNLGAGTNEDAIIFTNIEDHLLHQSDLIFAEPERNNLTLSQRLTVFQYINYTAGRYPKSTAVIRGTGLITPVF